MSTPTERYQNLGLEEALRRAYQYPIACKELSFILREAYSKVPKSLQSLIFQDTLTAFHLLPNMQTANAVSAAHLLLQKAEAALPKQKKNLAVTEFKHAKVAYKRRRKARQEEENGSVQLPQDVLVHIFSFLDMQSLVSAGLVSWLWSLAASENILWQSQFDLYFGNSDHCLKTKLQNSGRMGLGREHIKLPEDMSNGTWIDWKEAFKSAYIGNSSKKITSNRGYCWYCKAIVWLDNLKCSRGHREVKSQNQQIKHISTDQVVQYVLNDPSWMIYSSDSDSDFDEESFPGLWALPKHLHSSNLECNFPS